MVIKALVLGATGLLGSSIAKHFSNFVDYQVLCPTRSELDLLSCQDLTELLEKEQPEIIINCAANVGGLYSQMEKPSFYLHQNLMITGNVFDSVAKVSRKSYIVNFLSTCCFPSSVSFPITTEQLHNGPPHPSNSSYSYAKRMIDVYSSSYAKELQIYSSTFILGNLFGLNDHFSDPDNAHVIPSLITKAFKSVNDETYILEVQGNGLPLREFLFADDVAVMLKSFFESDLKLQPNNLYLYSNHNEISIRDLSRLIARLVSPDKEIEIIFKSTTDPGQARKPSRSSQVILNLPNIKTTPIEQALSLVVDDYKKRNHIVFSV